MDALLQDLRFGARKLAASPGFTAVAVLTLALGIGANGAIFSLLDAVLLRPLHLEDADRVIYITDRFPDHEMDLVSVPNFDDYRAGTTDLFSSFGAFQRTPIFLEGSEGDRELRGLYISADVLQMTTFEPRSGRFFTAAEDQGALEHVAILTHDFWQRHFDGDEDAVGRTLRLKYWSSGGRAGQPQGFHGELFTVIGVLPPDFELPPVPGPRGFQIYDPEILIPMGLWSWGMDNRGMHAFKVLAELDLGASLEDARSRLDTIAARIAADHPDTHGDYRASATVLPDLLAARYRPIFLLLGGSVAMILLLACVNVATLLLARSTARRAEFAVRGALGADRRRLARQALTESALLALLGGAAGIVVAHGTSRILLSLMPSYMTSYLPRLHEAGTDLRTVAFTFGVAAAAVLLFGSPPAILVGRLPFAEGLKEGGRDGSGGPRRLLAGLQMMEIALAVVLLVGAGLLARSLLRLTQVDLGLDTRRKLVVHLQLSPPELSKYRSESEVQPLWQQIRERLQGVAGVEWTEAISEPSIDGREGGWEVTLADPERPGTFAITDWRLVSPGYLPRLGVALRAGRYFEEADVERPVVIVDETLAQRFWPEGGAVGGELYWGRQDLREGLLPSELDERARSRSRPPEVSAADRERLDALLARLGDRVDQRYPLPFRMTVVGVVGHVRNQGPAAHPAPQAYVPLRAWRSASMVMLTRLEPERLAAPVEAAIREIDATEPRIASMRAMEDYVSATTAEPRFRTTLVGAFAVVALLLATVGLHGVVAYSVSRRIREMGVRRALGAQSGDIVRLVLGEGVRLAIWGLVPGVLLGLALSRYLESVLFEVARADPWTYGAVCLLILCVTALASYLPARRAVRVDPVESLRAE